MKYITFGKPCYGNTEVNDVLKILKSKWIGTGKTTLKFEENFRKFKNIKYSVALNSCTAALHLALLSLNIKKNDEVITTSMTFCSTINTILHVGATPVLVDINEHLNIDPDQIEKQITKKTKAIVVVHFAGLCCDMIKIKKICKKYSLKLIEDCAHSIESKFNNKHAGTFGLAGCFSFYATKNITTGEGGMLVTNNKTIEQKVRKLSLHGMDVDAWKRYNKSGKYKYYSVTSAGYKYNLTNLQAALGINQLKEIENKWKKRKKIWNYYQKQLKNLPLILPKNFDKKKYKHAYHLYTLLIDTKKTGKTRTEIIDFLQANNIGIGVHYFSIQSFNFYKNKVKYNLKRLKYSTYVGNNTFSIPIYSELKKNEMKHIVKTIKKFFNA